MIDVDDSVEDEESNPYPLEGEEGAEDEEIDSELYGDEDDDLDAEEKYQELAEDSDEDDQGDLDMDDDEDDSDDHEVIKVQASQGGKNKQNLKKGGNKKRR
jgi:ribonuclease E